ncbi:hypothetical protein EJ05DRAFT_467396 [Pseudovirgaria hyperparasitica]|uniref:THO complex subunit 2 n=1 Tax=Pseudovirgaria hyperparasitica TaxID=470096 RepID=A0A6A6W1G0_9PEZI|nr:uncharacterized protein EJ05DRAFT_467396 [Pseudovirgaria hyperparasitica]KAF2755969.1 hypothetical protein EJ05DRAFT_467396 [Pseudovirgaria hyperparasitica]
MAPANKRKRGDRTFAHDSNDGGRPSPHRPQEMNTGGQNKSYNSNNNNRGGRRGSRGGRGGGYQPPRSPATPARPSQNPTPTAMSPPQNPSFNKPPPAQSVQQPRIQAPPNLDPVPLPNPNGIPFYYEYITDSCISSWKAEGRNNLVNATKQALVDDDYLVFNIVFQELIRAGLDGHLDATEAGATVKDILADAVDADNASQFLDTLSVMIEGLNPIPPRLHPLLVATEIDPMQMRTELDVPVLTALGLIRDTFFRSSIRKTTNELYRQCAFNLLREESEGYSKLMTEYFQAVNEQGPSGPFVAKCFEKVKALIGTFDLDVGRVLDVTLDVFASLLVKHHKFFIKLLRCSYWWPVHRAVEGIEVADPGFTSLPNWAEPDYEKWFATDDEKSRFNSLREIRDQGFWLRVKEIGMGAFFELGGRRIIKDRNETKVSNGDSNGVDEAEQEDTDAQWRRITGLLPPSGNHIAAQLLGFKLRFYASSARDTNDILPDNLIYLAGLLIKIGFISILDLYPHLYPAEEDMPALKDKLMKEKAEREKKNRPGGGTMNALAMAGALVDDTLPPAVARLRAEEARASSLRPDASSDAGKREEDDKNKLPDPVDQKYKLLQTLLLMGAIPESLFILGRYPWLLDVYPDLPEHIHRILHQCLSKVYDPLKPIIEEDGLRTPKKIAEEVGGLTKGQLSLNDGYTRRVLRWAQLDRMDAGDNGTDYKYYWDEWTDNVPICQNVDDVFTLCGSLLNLSGVKIGRDSKLMIKLARIGKMSLEQDPSNANFKRWQDLCKRLLVPALSLASGNPGVLNEVFELLQRFSTAVRYNMYAEWFTGATSRLPDIAVAFDQSKAETKDVLKRISKENVKQMARALAKIANGSPGIVFQVTLNQIESYSNLITVVIECAKYFTYLGYDVLTWSLLNSLGGRGRDRMQGDGMLTSPWLKALSTFTGGVFKRYANMDPTPVLQYITYQLRNGVSTDLEILEQMLEIMSGVRSEIEFNGPQVLAMAGSTTLRARTLAQVLDHRTKPETQLSAHRLIQSLVKPRLAAPLLISIAQERQVHVFRDENKDVPLKVAANNLDKLHHLFVQYLDVLRYNLNVDEFDSIVPDLVSLIAEYGVEPSIAWAICRDSLTKKINGYDAALKEKKEQDEKERKAHSTNQVKKSDDDVEMVDNESKPVVTAEGESSRLKQDEDMKDAPQSIDATTPTTAPADPADPSHPILKEIAERLKSALPEDLEDRMSLAFYTRFWQLGLHDLHVPMEQNTAETDKIRAQQAAIRAGKTDVSTSGRDRKKRQIAELNDEVDMLNAGAKSMLQVHTITFSRLKQENKFWFTSLTLNNAQLHQAILQDCFLPRILISAYDAHYVFRMLFYLHNAGTPGFHTWTMIDQIFKDKLLTPLIFQFTSREASNFGRFLNDLLKELAKWHATRDEYCRLAYGTKRDLPGLARKLDDNKKRPTDFLDFDEFRQSLFKWHNNLKTALMNCLKGGEYMHIRNSIIMLRAMHENFPSVDFMGKTLVESVREIAQNDTRGDLKLMAQSLVGLLSRRQKSWIMPQAFRPGGAVGSTGRGGSARPDTPQPGISGLNATASEFKPVGKANGAVTKPGGGDDDSDGEIDETKGSVRQRTANAPAGMSSANDTKPMDQESAPGKMEVEKHRASDYATPPTFSASGPQKPDGSRPPSQPAASRVQHALPNRPDGFSRGKPNDRPLDRSLDYRSHANSTPQADGRRLPPNGEYGRLEQVGETYPYRDPRERSPNRGVRGRSSERDRREPNRDPNWMGTRELSRDHPDNRRVRPMPSRDGLSDVRPPYESPRDGRDRFGPDSRPSPTADGHRRLQGVGPVSSPARDDRIAPGPYPPRGSDGSRGEGARGDGPRSDYRDERGTPSERPPLSGYSIAPHDRRDDPSGGPPPSGPRGERGGMRELFQPSNNPRNPADPDHGRLNREFTQPARPNQDPNYGRLNSGSEVPSGPRPRGRPGRESRNFANVQGASVQPPASPASDRAPPGPLDDRREQRSADLMAVTSSAPPTPSTEQPTATEIAGIHPSRLNHIQTDVPPPSGPRNSQRPLAGPSPSARGPPTGPAFGSDRERPPRSDHRGEDKRFVGVQNILQQANSGGSFERNPTDRGAPNRAIVRPGRSSGLPSPNQPSTPISVNPDNVQPPTGGRDLMASNSQGETGSQDERNEGRGSRRDGRDSKSSRHRERERSPRGEKEGSNRRERDDGRTEHRDKRPTTSAERPERSERPERVESGRESSRRNGREEGRERDRGNERGGEREREHRERREGRGDRDREREAGGSHLLHQSSRNEGRRPPLPPQAPPPGPLPNNTWQGDRPSDMRIRGEGHRRDSGDLRGGERGGRKRGRGDEPGSGPQGGHLDKRPRRSQG